MRYNEESLLPDERKYLLNILHKVSKTTGVNITSLKKKGRGLEEVSLTRQLYFYLAKTFEPFDISLGKVSCIVNRDHATALHGIKKIRGYLETNNLLVVGLIDKLSNSIKATKKSIFDKIDLDVLVQYTAALLMHDGTINDPAQVARQAKAYAEATIEMYYKGLEPEKPVK